MYAIRDDSYPLISWKNPSTLSGTNNILGFFRNASIENRKSRCPAKFGTVGHPSKRKWIEMDRNGFVLFVSNPDSDLLNSFLSN